MVDISKYYARAREIDNATSTKKSSSSGVDMSKYYARAREIDGTTNRGGLVSVGAVSTPKVTQPGVKTPTVSTPTVDYQSYLETLDIGKTDRRIRELEQQIRAAKAADSTVPMQGIADNRSWEEIYAESEAKAAKIRPLEKELQQLKHDRERARAAQYDKKGSEKLSAVDSDTLSLLDALRPKQETPTVEMQGVADNRSWEERYAQSEAAYAQARAALRQKGYTDSEITELVKHRQRQTNRQNYDAEVAKSAKEAAERPGAASLKSVPQNLTGGLGYLSLAAQKANRALTGSDTPLDYYTPEMVGQAKAQAARQTVSQRLEENTTLSTKLTGNVASFLYNTGMSMADSAAIAAMAAVGVPPGLGTTLLAGTAATAATVEAKERGVSDEQALLTGLSAGIAEGVFEKISLDRLLQTKPAVGTLRQKLKQTVYNMGIQGTVEGSEELATSVANTLADAIINGDHSAYQKNLQTYLITDHSPEEARKLANRDWLRGIAGDFLGGFLSGGAMGGAGSFINRGGADADAADSNRSDTSGEKPSTVTPRELRGVQSATAAQDAPQRDALANIMFGPETQNTAASEETTVVQRQRVTMEDYTNRESSLWRNVEYGDTDTQESIMSQVHDEMVADGSVVAISEATQEQVRQSFPDLRSMKKAERTPILRQKMNELKATLRQFLGTLKASSFEFDVNGHILEARLYDTGIAEVMDRVTQDKAGILLHSADIFKNARYLYSTPDYDGDPNVYRWNYFYTPVRMGDETVGVRIAIRDMATPAESQIYHWGAKKDATLDGAGRGNSSRISGGVSSVTSSVGAVDRSSTSQPAYADHVDISRPATTFGDTVSQNEQVVNSADATNTVGAAAQGFDPFTALQNKYGTLPSGENPVRSDDVPVSTDGTDRVSLSARTIIGAEATPDSRVETVERLVAEGKASHIPVTNETLAAEVEARIRDKGFHKALTDWTVAVRSGNVSDVLVAEGAILLNNAGNSEMSEQEYADLVIDYMNLSTNSGRATQAFRLLKKLTPSGQLYMMERSRENLQQELNERYGDAKAPQLTISEELYKRFRSAETQAGRDEAMRDIYRSLGRQMPSRFVDKWNAWRYLAMLGNARTHIRNIAGNAVFTIPVGAKTGIATGIEAAVYRVSGGKLERTKAPISGELWRAAWNDYANARDAIQSGRKYGELEHSNRYIEEGREIFRFKPLETVRRKNSEALDAEDTWFSRPHYALALAQYCSANGIKAEDLQSGEVLAKARDYAIREAQKATFRDTNALSQALVDLGQYDGKNPVKKGISVLTQGLLPFRKTPANILARGLEYSPAGLIKAITWDIGELQKGKITGAEMIDRISAGLTGTGLVAVGMWLGAQGLVRGGDDEDEKQAAFDDLTGHQAYALELEDGTSVTLDWLAPESIPFFMGVNMAQMRDEEGKPLTLSTLLSAAKKITDPLLEMSCLQSLNDAFDAVGYVSDSGVEGFPAFVAAMATSYLTQAVPTLFGQLERISEDKRYTTYTGKGAQGSDYMTGDMQYTLGKMLQRVPGVDFSQIPYIDAWGREEETGDVMVRAVNNLFNPAYVSQVDVDAVERELQRLYDATGTGSVLPSRADKSFAVNKETRYLTAEEYVKYAKAKGQNSYRYVSQAVNSAAYRAMSDEGKAELVEKLYKYANYKAKRKTVPEYDNDDFHKAEKAEAAGVSPAAFYAAKMQGDTDGNGSITKAEAQRYLDGQRELSTAEKFDLWDLICSTGAGNPYS